MRSKGLIALLLVTTAAVVVAVLGSLGGTGTGANPRIDQAVLPVLGQHLTDVAHITLVHGANKTTLVRADGTWVVEEKGNYPADMAEVTQVVLGLADLRYVEPKTQKPDLYPRLEVEDAGKPDGKSTLVTVSDPKGTVLGEVIAGKQGIDQLGGGSDGVYVRTAGRRSGLARSRHAEASRRHDRLARPQHRRSAARASARGRADPARRQQARHRPRQAR